LPPKSAFSSEGLPIALRCFLKLLPLESATCNCSRDCEKRRDNDDDDDDGDDNGKSDGGGVRV
jgi:hypothetical protein